MGVNYSNAEGWARIDDLVSSDRARSILGACLALLDGPETDRRVGDKPHGGTRTLSGLMERVPETEVVVAALEPWITAVMGHDHRLTEAAFRCPQPGFGQQRLHADDVPKLDAGPNLCATAIVPLVEFTVHNGSTRLVPGSHLRPDLQRQAGSLPSHPDQMQFTGPVGSALVFSGHLLHSGMENRSEVDRPALQFVFRAGPG